MAQNGVFLPKSSASSSKLSLRRKQGLPKRKPPFFSPLLELQDRKKQLRDENWKLMREGKSEQTTEARYEEILESVYDNNIAVDRLDKTYFEKFKKILSFRKIYLVQNSEMRFHRELLRGMHGKNGVTHKNGQKGKR